MDKKSLNGMAVSATLHCLTGCAIGEIVGLMVGTALGWSNLATIALAITLAFATGYALSTLPLVKGGLTLQKALLTVLAADSLSILVMEIVDNSVEASIPGAMNAGLSNWLFWATLPQSLGVAFLVALPVNRWLLARGQGHALTHKYHNHGEHHE
jgi:hypothetical protein